MLNACTIPIEVKGRKRGFKFGMLCIGLVQQRTGCSFDQFLEKMGTSDIMFTLEILYAAAVAYSKSKNEEVDYTPEDVAEWMDEIGMIQAFSIINNAFTSYQAPASNDKPVKKKTIKQKK